MVSISDLPRVRIVTNAETSETRIMLVGKGVDLLTPVEAQTLSRELLTAARAIQVDGEDESGTPTTLATPGIDAHLVEDAAGRLTSAGHPRIAAVRAWRRPGGQGVEGVEWRFDGEPGPAGCEAVGGVIRAMVWRRGESE